MVIWNFVKEKNFVGQILVFVLLYSSLYSTYLWTGLLAVSLFLLKKRESVQIPVGLIIISGWGIPALLVGVLLITGKHNGDSVDSAFFYGKEQMITTAVTLFCSILIAGVSLMCMNRTTQAGHYEGFGQSQSHKPVEPGSTAFEESQRQQVNQSSSQVLSQKQVAVLAPWEMVNYAVHQYSQERTQVLAGLGLLPLRKPTSV